MRLIFLNTYPDINIRREYFKIELKIKYHENINELIMNIQFKTLNKIITLFKKLIKILSD